ncbi:hypothetical protein BDM02DRAFT_3113640 [Thelephora ganbajun]|uniref:Uncharacterized protein n=1 Tax=Thelephora ganbajun TaxID=370292 RepID=A0ACB6ZI39_THEGA|nr:hypothetical protein BDM02DRAFT_3113640 [Thelephora ganbajun]
MAVCVSRSGMFRPGDTLAALLGVRVRAFRPVPGNPRVSILYSRPARIILGSATIQCPWTPQCSTFSDQSAPPS